MSTTAHRRLCAYVDRLCLDLERWSTMAKCAMYCEPFVGWLRWPGLWRAERAHEMTYGEAILREFSPE